MVGDVEPDHVGGLSVCVCASVWQYLYTLKVTDADKAEKLTQSLPPGLQRKDI